MGNGQLMEFASTAKHYSDLVDEDNELPYILEGGPHCFRLESSDACGMDTVIGTSS